MQRRWCSKKSRRSKRYYPKLPGNLFVSFHSSCISRRNIEGCTGSGSTLPAMFLRFNPLIQITQKNLPWKGDGEELMRTSSPKDGLISGLTLAPHFNTETSYSQWHSYHLIPLDPILSLQISSPFGKTLTGLFWCLFWGETKHYLPHHAPAAFCQPRRELRETCSDVAISTTSTDSWS